MTWTMTLNFAQPFNLGPAWPDSLSTIRHTKFTSRQFNHTVTAWNPPFGVFNNWHTDVRSVRRTDDGLVQQLPVPELL